ncbi:hypothetical protein PoB_004070000 [Plakobranchus ocellatus]|uniref:Uncharacterized protein n=1 Tax=Plakobranchus ocellatus TaxID=259542 RepID=A0AAV4B3Q5_9GAST|nr:hypothetical protein PoB_004070000 [Plakobranchus ocellatus]
MPRPVGARENLRSPIKKLVQKKEISGLYAPSGQARTWFRAQSQDRRIPANVRVELVAVGNRVICGQRFLDKKFSLENHTFLSPFCHDANQEWSTPTSRLSKI